MTKCVLLPTGAALLIRVFLAPCLSSPAGTHFHCTSVATWYPHSPHPSLLTLWATPQPIQHISSCNGRERGEKPQEDGWPWCSQLSPQWLTPLWAMALITSQSTHRFNKHRLVACWSSTPPSRLDSHFISRETFLFRESNFFLLWPQLSTHFQLSSCVAPGKVIMTWISSQERNPMPSGPVTNDSHWGMKESPQLRGADIHPSTPSGLSPDRSVALGQGHYRATSRLGHKDPNPRQCCSPKPPTFSSTWRKWLLVMHPNREKLVILKLIWTFTAGAIFLLFFPPAYCGCFFCTMCGRGGDGRRKKKKGSCLFTSQWKDLSCYYLALQFHIIWRLEWGHPPYVASSKDCCSLQPACVLCRGTYFFLQFWHLAT